MNDVWVVTTEAMDSSIDSLTNWQQKMIPDIGLKIYPCTGVSDLSSTRDCNRMADLIFRTVLHATRQADKLLISLAGGRKTMSADMQRAAFFSGAGMASSPAQSRFTLPFRWHLEH